ncbi:disulfide bond formation protein B [Rhabdaerophilum calidifontis]|uniref:disulfide bond formation protein B n=1 Tax=Rhabdaerophilum calidifontis TaxID=2604328 RepID=UPI00123995EC|nr:disulfide bond formation protein B [Rhabdaerophilum calidifontis]
MFATLSGRMAGLATLLALAAIGGAWFSELGLGYVPCKLCLLQRWPYYIALPPAMALMVWGRNMPPRAAALVAGLLALAFLVSIGLGIYHAGVEWKLWAGPADCGGRLTTEAPSLDDFRKSLNTARVVLCDEAPLRVLGLSFAGWNAVVSALVTGLYAAAARGFSLRSA